MKRTYLFFIAVLITVSGMFAQSPRMFKYQAVIRNADGNILANETVTIDIAILHSDMSTVAYSESHTGIVTTELGLINLNIGSEGDMSVVDWNADEYFFELSVNGTVMGTSQILSVPYAMLSKDVENIDYSQITNTPFIPTDISGLTDSLSLLFDGEWSSLTGTPPNVSVFNNDAGYLTTYTETQTLSDVISNNPSAGNANITNLADPVNEQDAVTKSYVDILDERVLLLEGVTDIDGNSYKVAKTGTQIWMGEDLRVSHYPNGTPIPYITDNALWAGLANDNTSDAFCYYNNNYITGYGALYTYAAAIADNWENDNTDGQGICPDGWHLPTSSEWMELSSYLGGTSIAGGKMKEAGYMHWSSPNTGATNESCFKALPGGGRLYTDGTFYAFGTAGFWWTATEWTESYSYRRDLYCDSEEIPEYYDYKSLGYSVRCVKD